MRLLKIAILVVITAAAIAVIPFIDPIPQDTNYHSFADSRLILSIPNFWNVISNLIFLFVGIFGVFKLIKKKPEGMLEEIFSGYIVFYIGILLTGIGSSYYHINPTNETLVWDRIPMTISFMAFFSIIIGENIGLNLGRRLLWPLIFLGILSVFYWHITESEGKGDLRPYVLVQYLPMILIPLILMLFKARFGSNFYIWAVIALYSVSKIFEAIDVQLFNYTGFISGHSIKHIASAAAPLFFLMALERRRVDKNLD